MVLGRSRNRARPLLLTSPPFVPGFRLLRGMTRGPRLGVHNLSEPRSATCEVGRPSPPGTVCADCPGPWAQPQAQQTEPRLPEREVKFLEASGGGRAAGKERSPQASAGYHCASSSALVISAAIADGVASVASGRGSDREGKREVRGKQGGGNTMAGGGRGLCVWATRVQARCPPSSPRESALNPAMDPSPAHCGGAEA